MKSGDSGSHVRLIRAGAWRTSMHRALEESPVATEMARDLACVVYMLLWPPQS